MLEFGDVSVRWFGPIFKFEISKLVIWDFGILRFWQKFQNKDFRQGKNKLCIAIFISLTWLVVTLNNTDKEIERNSFVQDSPW